MNNQTKNILIWVGAFILCVIIFNLIGGGGLIEDKKSINFSDFLNRVEEKQVQSVKIQGRTLEGKLSDGTSFSTYAGEFSGLLNKLHENEVVIEVVPPDTKMNSLFSIFVSWFPMFVLIMVWIIFMRQHSGGKALGFGKSKAKMMSDKQKVTFADVAGIDEAKDELYELVDFLRDPMKFQKLGGKIPKGCLLIGPPGTGKTLLARAIAGEAGVPFFSISGSDFVEMFVGVGASRVRDMFEQGKRNAPCLIFVDEIDAVGRHRGVGVGGGNDEREQTLNQLLVEMDGFEANEGVIILAATNRPDVLDPALLRPGRFDRQIAVPPPDIDGREKILLVHLAKIKHNSKIDVRTIAKGIPGFSGAEIANLVNEAALLAARKGKKEVDLEDLEMSKDKVMMGIERRSMVISPEEQKITAYHEGGHAIVAFHTEASDKIHKVTIIPRGNALGMVVRLPEKDRLNMTLEKMCADIAVAMGGRVAEELIFGHDKITSGASSDIKVASQIARSMVKKLGMSKDIGPVYYGEKGDDVYTGRSDSTYSEKMIERLDAEIEKLISQGYQTAKNILTTHMDQLHLLAKTLIEKETLTGKEVADLLCGVAEEDSSPESESNDRAQTQEAPKPKTKKTSSTKNKTDDQLN